MAHRIRNFDNLSVSKVNEIFRRGRGFDRRPALLGAAPAEDEDFTRAMDAGLHHTHIPMMQAEVADDELEAVK